MEKFDYLKSIILPHIYDPVTPVIPIANVNHQVINYTSPQRSGNVLAPGQQSELVMIINARNTYVGVGMSSSILVYHAIGPLASGLLNDRYGAPKSYYATYKSAIVHSNGTFVSLTAGTSLDYKLYIYHKSPLHLAERPADLDLLPNMVTFTGSIVAGDETFFSMPLDLASYSCPDQTPNPGINALYPAKHCLIQLTNNTDSPVTYTYNQSKGRVAFTTSLTTQIPINSYIPIEFAPYILYFIGHKYTVTDGTDTTYEQYVAEIDADIIDAIRKLSSGWLELTNNIGIRNAGSLVNFIVFYLD